MCTDRGAEAWGNRGRHPRVGLEEPVGFINGPNNVLAIRCLLKEGLMVEINTNRPNLSLF